MGGKKWGQLERGLTVSDGTNRSGGKRRQVVLLVNGGDPWAVLCQSYRVCA